MKKVKLINCILSLIFIIVSVTGCKQTLMETKNFIWKAAKGQNTVYLVGTMHAMPEGYRLISDKLDSIINETDGLAAEFNILDQINTNKLQQELAQ
jgi:uncharacterized protein YbaP (TraB family)